MTSPEQIHEAGNTLVPAVLALRALGFAVHRVIADGVEHWRAEKPGLTLVSDNPMALLGLAAMRKSRGANWKATDDEINDILSEYDFDDRAG